MSAPKSDKKFLSLLLVFIAFFIFVFFTKSYYSDLVVVMDENEEKERVYQERLEQAETLSKRAKDLKKLEGSTDDENGKYLQTLKEDELIKMIYSFATNYGENGRMKILGIDMSEGIKNELGFNEAKLHISARVQNKKVMADFLDFLIDNPKYKFFITSFNMPKDTSKAFNIQVPVTFFYKELITQ